MMKHATRGTRSGLKLLETKKSGGPKNSKRKTKHDDHNDDDRTNTKRYGSEDIIYVVHDSYTHTACQPTAVYRIKQRKSAHCQIIVAGTVQVHSLLTRSLLTV